MSKKEFDVCDGCGKIIEEIPWQTDWYGLSNCPDKKDNGTQALRMSRVEGAKIDNDGHLCESCEDILISLGRKGYTFNFKIVPNKLREICKDEL